MIQFRFLERESFAITTNSSICLSSMLNSIIEQGELCSCTYSFVMNTPVFESIPLIHDRWKSPLHDNDDYDSVHLGSIPWYDNITLFLCSFQVHPSIYQTLVPVLQYTSIRWQIILPMILLVFDLDQTRPLVATGLNSSYDLSFDLLILFNSNGSLQNEPSWVLRMIIILVWYWIILFHSIIRIKMIRSTSIASVRHQYWYWYWYC